MTGQQLIDTAVLNPTHAYIRFRHAKWANPNAYLRLSVVEHAGVRRLGPWGHLFDRVTQEMISEPTPQVFLTIRAPFRLMTFPETEFDVWTGALDPADT